jgi:hypothetical protein
MCRSQEPLVARCDEFYAQRDRRSWEYLGGEIPGVPVQVVVGRDAVRTRSGQLAAVALMNQLARLHRRVEVRLSGDAPLIVSTPFDRTTLRQTLLHTYGEIDPCGTAAAVQERSAGAIAVGLGEEDVPNDLDWYLGASAAVGQLSHSPQPFADSPWSMRGAAAAACLGAAAVLRTALRLPTTARVLSAWNYCEGDLAHPGPESLDPIDVGTVLMVGAGAVASALVFWMRAFGVVGRWLIIDRDRVAVHNTNRGLLFTPAGAGWPRGEADFKADVLAKYLPGSEPFREWYHECRAITHERVDVVLPLANEYGARSLLAARNSPVVLHATTGRNWLAQLHRHVAGTDDCVRCRTAEVEQEPTFGCSTVEIGSRAGKESDAALPFLSAASGLMLATLLQRLHAGVILADAWNDWRWDFGSAYRLATRGVRPPCGAECPKTLPPDVRRKVNAATRWASLDSGS